MRHVVNRKRGRRGQAEKRCGGGQYDDAAPQAVSTHGKDGRHYHGAGQHDPAQRRQEVRRPIQQNERPHTCACSHDGQHDPWHQEFPSPPQLVQADMGLLSAIVLLTRPGDLQVLRRRIEPAIVPLDYPIGVPVPLEAPPGPMEPVPAEPPP